ncbi:asparaginase domain-containing protein [Oceanobacillus timonensis]|uniref:asparaginase domain-containing protein n=1 Tax=Oceanobacillus timonensis TaxID=1926285 RepID=UPI001C4E29CC
MATGYQPGALSIDALLKEVPDLANVANINIKQLFNIKSADLTTERLLALSK